MDPCPAGVLVGQPVDTDMLHEMLEQPGAEVVVAARVEEPREHAGVGELIAVAADHAQQVGGAPDPSARCLERTGLALEFRELCPPLRGLSALSVCHPARAAVEDVPPQPREPLELRAIVDGAVSRRGVRSVGLVRGHAHSRPSTESRNPSPRGQTQPIDRPSSSRRRSRTGSVGTSTASSGALGSNRR